MTKVAIIAGSSPAVSPNRYTEVSNMKSNKQRRIEIKAKRRKRAETMKARPYKAYNYRPLNSVEANQNALANNNTYGLLPSFYIDKPFKCKDCGVIEIWKASSQKWWYEIAMGHIDSTAIHCHPCRVKRKREKEEQKAHMKIMAQRVPHPNESFFQKTLLK